MNKIGITLIATFIIIVVFAVFFSWILQKSLQSFSDQLELPNDVVSESPEVEFVIEPPDKHEVPLNEVEIVLKQEQSFEAIMTVEYSEIELLRELSFHEGYSIWLVGDSTITLFHDSDDPLFTPIVIYLPKPGLKKYFEENAFLLYHE